MDFKEKYGPWALITGASSGIGEEFAKQLAQKGLNVVLVARRIDRLKRLAKEIENTFKVNAEVVQADLTKADFLTGIKKVTDGWEVGLLVSNAGMMYIGNYFENSIENELKMIDLNIKAPAILTHHFGQRMIKRKKGGIIYTASMLGFIGTPYSSAYAGTKAQEIVKAEGLAYELKSKGIDILVLNPGLTKTEMTANNDFSGMPMKLMNPDLVAKSAIDGIGKKTLVTPGFMNNMMNWMSKHLMSRKMNTKMFGGFMKKTF